MRERALWSGRLSDSQYRATKRYHHHQYLKQLALYDWSYEDAEWLEADLRSAFDF